MKKLLFLVVMVCYGLNLFGQMTELGRSAVFPELTKGDAKIIMLKNGNTALLHNTAGSLRVQLYDPSYKMVATKNYSGNVEGMKKTSILRSFELGDNIVIFFEGYVKQSMLNSTPTLTRLIINSSTGNLVEKKKLEQLPKIRFVQGYAMAFGGVPVPGFYVRKDENSDYYAVLINNSFEKDRNKTLEIVHYDVDSKVVGRAFLTTPEGEYKYLRFTEMVVSGAEEVNTLLYAFNTRSTGGEKHQLFLSTLKGNTVSYTEIALDEDADFQQSIGKYNKTTNQIVFLNLIEMSRREAKAKGVKTKANATYYTSTILLVDKDSKKVRTIDQLNMNELNKASQEYYGKNKSVYQGVPVNLFINEDGGFTVLLEGYRVQTTTRTSGTRVYTTYTYYLEDLGVVFFDKTGRQMRSKFLPKSQQISSAVGSTISVGPLYHNAYENSAFPIVVGNQYKSFAYLNGKDGNFIMYNESRKNMAKLGNDKKVRSTVGVSGLDAFYFDLKSVAVQPESKMLFKDAGNNKHNLGMFCVSDYDERKDIYTTLKLESVGKSKKMRIVWLQPE